MYRIDQWTLLLLTVDTSHITVWEALAHLSFSILHQHQHQHEDITTRCLRRRSLVVDDDCVSF